LMPCYAETGRSHPLIARLYEQLYYFGSGFYLAT
jgi:hypothetical protein